MQLCFCFHPLRTREFVFLGSPSMAQDCRIAAANPERACLQSNSNLGRMHPSFVLPFPPMGAVSLLSLCPLLQFTKLVSTAWKDYLGYLMVSGEGRMPHSIYCGLLWRGLESGERKGWTLCFPLAVEGFPVGEPSPVRVMLPWERVSPWKSLKELQVCFFKWSFRWRIAGMFPVMWELEAGSLTGSIPLT